MKAAPLALWTIGHSTRSTDEFIEALRAYGIELLVDVRRFPASRRLPQFASDALEHSLADAGIAYCWIEQLGGRRHVKNDDEAFASGWRNSSFRSYALYTQTPEFAAGLAELLDLACSARTAIMCAEVLWWRCHRRLIADVTVSLGGEVVHIRDATHAEPHRLTPPARLVNGALTYAAP